LHAICGFAHFLDRRQEQAPPAGAGRTAPSVSAPLAAAPTAGIASAPSKVSAVAVIPSLTAHDAMWSTLAGKMLRTAAGAAARGAGRSVPPARRGRGALLGGRDRTGDGVVRGGACAGPRRDCRQTPNVDVPSGTALRRLAEDQASADEDLFRARDCFLISMRPDGPLLGYKCPPFSRSTPAVL